MGAHGRWPAVSLVLRGAAVRVMSPSARRRTERLMTDRCVVRRPTGETVTDPDTLVVSPVLAVVYDPELAPHFGKVRVNAYEAFEQERESAGATAVINRVRCDFPVGSAHFLAGDVVTVLGSVDPFLVGRHLRLTVEAPYKTHTTAYRVFAEVNVGMEVPPWP